MSIEKIVKQALEAKHLTPAMQTEVDRVCSNASDLSIEEYMALDQLMNALLSGDVSAVPPKQFINVMEELVLSEVITRVSKIEQKGNQIDLGDIAAYALNRLPPMYATTEEGAEYQRCRSREELTDLIEQEVNRAIAHYLNQPEFFPERQALGKSSGDSALFGQITTMLQSYAQKFETHAG